VRLVGRDGVGCVVGVATVLEEVDARVDGFVDVGDVDVLEFVVLFWGGGLR